MGVRVSIARRAAARRAGVAAAVALAAVGMSATAGSASGRAALSGSPAPAISPLPGTPDASPETQISILGIPPGRIESVTVTGSSTGRHAGRLRAYSGGRGASFVPVAPFAQGESVGVTVRIRGLAARRFTFTVARLAATLPFLSADTLQPGKLQHFISAPELLAPRITVLRAAPGLAGDVLLTPLPSPIVHPGSRTELTVSPVGPGGPMIINGRGRLVWFAPLAPPLVAADLQLESYRGRPVLTWWQGGVTPAAFGRGVGIIADTSYRTVATVRAGNGYAMDLHEFRLTADGDALFTVYSRVLVHLAGTPPGALSPLLDAIVQEVDIRTGLVIWEWHALGHIPLSDSYATPANSVFYDAFHINAIQPLSGGRLLISARDASAVYLVDQRTGQIVWTLGGKASSFRLGRGARFHFQHDAGLLAGGRIGMFDDEAGPPRDARSSRGLILALNPRRRTATLVAQYHRPGVTSAESEGSLQLLAGGDVFLGFGSEPFVSQFAANGRLLFDARLPYDDGSYRAQRVAWQATPAGRPAVVARRARGVSVDVSWNGATAVARWQVLGGRTSRSLAPLATVAVTGFETRIALRAAPAMVAVRALGTGGRVLSRSAVVTVS